MRSLNSDGAELDQGRFHDFSLAELSGEMRNRLEVCHEPNWFSSMGFAEYYCFPPAERVSFVENASGETTEKCFYRERKWAGMFRELELCGPIDPRNSLLGELLLRHRVSAAHVQWVAAADLPEWKATLDAVRTERIGEDSCIELPKSCSEYLQRLGRKTRKHLPYYVRRLQREWGEEWAFEHHYGAEISRESYDRLLDLNCLRLSQKGIKAGWTPELREHRWRSVKDCGLLCSLVYGGRIVAGTFSFVHANEVYLIAIAHDPQFDELNLGSVVLWRTIEYLIQRGFSRFHLMWGQSFYKKQFGGSTKPLYRVTVFANPFIAGCWHVADYLLVTKAWRFAVRVWRRASWSIFANRVNTNKSSDSSDELLVDATPGRLKRD